MSREGRFALSHLSALGDGQRIATLLVFGGHSFAFLGHRSGRGRTASADRREFASNVLRHPACVIAKYACEEMAVGMC
jgi:hypothetical protein